ncbi:hypothetical protein [Bulleidia extructa]|uniref:hypothetical protein n=1 Tax=Bulleidia extructa TaxID=118748 RepID=UPI003BF0FDCE
MIVSAFNVIKTGDISLTNLLVTGIIGISVVVIVISSFFGSEDDEAINELNFYNLDAYVLQNPYTQAELYSQCTWFALGRFYELYVYSPGFTRDGWNCTEQVVEAHPDKWELSNTPTDLCVSSGIGVNYVRIILYY